MPSYCCLFKDRFEVIALSELSEEFIQKIPALDFLQLHAKPGQYCGTAKGFYSVFKRYAEGGRSKLTAALFHEVDKSEKIWEFVKGDLRIFCFLSGEKAVLTHGAIKKSQKVDSQEVARAVTAKNLFLKN